MAGKKHRPVLIHSHPLETCTIANCKPAKPWKHLEGYVHTCSPKVRTGSLYFKPITMTTTTQLPVLQRPFIFPVYCGVWCGWAQG